MFLNVARHLALVIWFLVLIFLVLGIWFLLFFKLNREL